MINQDYLLSRIIYMDTHEITHKIIGCAMKVHGVLKNGFQEVIYQRALAIEMKMQGLSFEREKEMKIHYEGFDIGTRRVDFFVENCVMLELKAVIEMDNAHLAQAMNYLEAYNVEIGLLINFGAKSLQFNRIYNNKLKSGGDKLLTHSNPVNQVGNRLDNQGLEVGL